MTLEQRLRSMRKTMRDMFGIARLRAGQEDIIRSVLERRDTPATMPTGASKSLCYQLPALHLDGTTLVVSPLIALMKDQADKLLAAGIDCTLVNSTLRCREEREALQRIGTGKSGIVFVTPERLAQPAFMKALRASAGQSVGLVVVDEAHCVSQWGHDFRPAFLEIANAVRALGQPPVLALTATATAPVLEDIIRSLGLREPRVVRTGTLRENLRYRVVQVSVGGGKDGAVRATQAKLEQLRTVVASSTGTGIIYTATVRDAEGVYAWLAEAGVRIALSRQAGAGRARSRAGGIHVRRDTADGCHQCVWHGYRQARHSLCRPLSDAGQPRCVLPGNWRRGPRRSTGRLRTAVDLNDRRIQQFFLKEATRKRQGVSGKELSITACVRKENPIDKPAARADMISAPAVRSIAVSPSSRTT
jgi:ATP-dependent DNA helicase RecQ